MVKLWIWLQNTYSARKKEASKIWDTYYLRIHLEFRLYDALLLVKNHFL